MSTAPTSSPPAGGESNPLVDTDPKQMRRILTSSFVGSMIEFYDFMLFATAATVVFPKVFFPDASPAMAAVGSFATLTLGHLMRPLGAVIFGHFGDRMGRKKVLVTAILAMGVCTVLIGCVPSASSIGSLSILILVVLRAIQGIAVGGEWGGAMLIALEHAPGGKRGFAASFATLGGPAGTLLATLSISLLAGHMNRDDFLSWGWRIPFWATVVLIVLGLYIRLNVEESPLFKQFQATSGKREVPLVDVFRRNLKQLVLGVLIATSMFTVQGIATVWGINTAINHGADISQTLNVKVMSALVLVVVTIISARVSDRVGRWPLMFAGMLGLAGVAYPTVQLIGSGDTHKLFIGVLMAQICQGVILGPLSAFLAELFPTRTRFTGAATAYQTASSLGGGVTPLVAASLVASTHTIGAVGFAWIAGVIVGIVALILARGQGERQDLARIA